MAKLKSEDPSFTINHWMRNRMTIEYLGLWESLYNPNFNPTEFGRFSNMENLNAVMIEDGIPQPQRLKRLNEIAIHQMKILSSGTDGRNLLK